MHSLKEINAVIGESPIWDDATLQLVWVEAAGKEMFKYSLINDSLKRYALPFEVTAVSPCNNHHWIFASKQGLFYSDPEFGRFTSLGDPCRHSSYLHLNDAVASPSGELWFGSMNSENLESPDGKLFKLLKQKVTELDEGFSVANGIAFNTKLKRAYCSNMFQRRVYEYQLNENMTQILSKNVFAEFATQEGFPDGLSVDLAGNLYICHWDYGMISYYRPNPDSLAKGKKLGQIRLPVKHATRCTFGGEGYRTLFVTTASYGMSEEERALYPLSGQVLVLDAPTTGKPEWKVNADLISAKLATNKIPAS